MRHPARRYTQLNVVRTSLRTLAASTLISTVGLASDGGAADLSRSSLATLAATYGRPPQSHVIADAVSGAGAGVQVTPDGKALLVSKDVGAERWAIHGSTEDDSLTGNVFRTDGGPPAFLWCTLTAQDGNPDLRERVLTYACFGADSCPGIPCNPDLTWSLINDEVRLKGSFFLP